MIRRVGRAVLALAVLLAGCGAAATKAATSVSTSSTTVVGTTSSSGAVPGTSASGASTTEATGAPPTTPSAFTATSEGGAVPILSGTVHLTDGDKGRSIRVAKSTIIVVVLNSTYWMFTTPSGGVLEQVGNVTTTPAPMGRCVPGAGCGTTTATYLAAGAGDAAVSASRTTCGEALLCTGTAGSYSVAVAVAVAVR